MAAKTKAEVDAQSAADRAWDSLNYSYDQKAKKINQNYDKAYSQASNQQLARGMQRSSYAGQVLAGVNQQRNQALSDNEDALIADYQKWRYQIDRDEVEDSKWWNQFNEGVRQFNASHELKRDELLNDINLRTAEFLEKQRVNTAENELAYKRLGQGQQQIDLQQQQINNQASQWATERGDKLTQQDWENRFAWEQADLAQKNNERDYWANRADRASDEAYRESEAERNQGNVDRDFWAGRADRASDEAYRDSEAQRNQSNIDRDYWHQVEREGVQDAQWSDETAYQRTRDALGDERYEDERDYTRSQADKNTAVNMAMTLLENGQMPTAEMLAAAGISEADAQNFISMYDRLNGSGSGKNGNGNNTPPPGDKDKEEKPTDNDVFNWLTATPQERKEQLDKTGKTGKDYLDAAYDATKNAFNDWAKGFFTGKKNNKK